MYGITTNIEQRELKMNITEITYKDRSEFLRGFAIIIRINNCGNLNEKTMFLTIGKNLGFEEVFCRESLETLMVNKYISEEPPVFSTEFIAKLFIKQVTILMLQAHSISDTTVEWLRLTANVNKVNFVT